MSDIGIGGERTEESGFRRGTILLIILVGIVAFVGTLVLGAYAPELRSGKNGGAHALREGGQRLQRGGTIYEAPTAPL